MKNYTLSLENKDIDYVLNVLSTRPYSESAAMIQNILNQVGAQNAPTALPEVKKEAKK